MVAQKPISTDISGSQHLLSDFVNFRAETNFSGSRYHSIKFFFTNKTLVNNIVLLQPSTPQVYEDNVENERLVRSIVWLCKNVFNSMTINRSSQAQRKLRSYEHGSDVNQLDWLCENVLKTIVVFICDLLFLVERISVFKSVAGYPISSRLKLGRFTYIEIVKKLIIFQGILISH